MLEFVKRGWTRTVGVSNFGQKRMLRAYSTLAQHGIPLASNQVHYSLLSREVEKNGTLARCKELGIRLIAYCPLEKGLLTGKYSLENPPPGVRDGSQTNELLKNLPPAIKLLNEIGQNHGGKSTAQVSLNWLICKGALPIPDAKNAKQAEQNAGGASWKLSEEEVAKLDEATDNIREYSKNQSWRILLFKNSSKPFFPKNWWMIWKHNQDRGCCNALIANMKALFGRWVEFDGRRLAIYVSTGVAPIAER